MVRPFLTVMLCICSSSVFSQDAWWEWQNPKPQGSHLRDVAMLDSTTYIAIGDAGLVVKTTDDGASWIFVTIPTKAVLNAIAFSPDKMHGITVTDKGEIFATTDQGATWTKTPGVVTTVLKDASYASEHDVVVVGNNGTILTSSDAGLTWNRSSFELSDHFHCVSFCDSLHGMISARFGSYFVTTTGAQDWVRKNFTFDNLLYSIDLFDPQYGIAGGEGGGLFLTNDSGTVWQRQELPIANVFYSVIRNSKERAFACDDYYGLIGTTDGGLHWEFKWNDTRRDHLRALSFSDVRHGVCVGYNGVILRSNDSGSTWYSVFEKIAESKTLRGVFCFDANTAVGVGSTIVRTTNAGKQWYEITSPTLQTLLSVDFPDNMTGYAVGDTGVAVKSTDKGLTWSTLQLPFTSRTHTVDFLDVEHGVVLGENKEFAVTSNGGGSWLATKIVTDHIITSVAYLSPTSIIAVGYGSGPGTDFGVVMHSSDLGQSWQEIGGWLPGFVIGSVSFVDTLHGYIAGCSGIGTSSEPMAAGTSDGGHFWKLGTVDGMSNAPIFSVSGADRKRATGVGGNGISIHTTDGGATWTRVETNSRANIWGVHHPNIQTATAVGYRAAILRLTTTDQPLAVGATPEAAEHLLTSIYPNPAKKATTLQLELPSPDVVRIELLTIEGQAVRTYYHGILNSGKHMLQADLGGLASGTYLVELRTNIGAEYHRLVVSK